MRALIAVDGSSGASAILDAVRPWLLASGASTELLSVIDSAELRATVTSETTPPYTLQTSWAGSAIPVDDPRPQIAEDRSQAIDRVEAVTREHLQQLAAARLAGIDCEIRVTIAEDAATAIVREACRAQVNAIVMGTHGRGGVARLVMGSVAEQVVRRSPMPVLLVRASVR